MSDNSAVDPNVFTMQVEEVPPAKFYESQLVPCLIKVCTSVHYGCHAHISSLSPPPSLAGVLALSLLGVAEGEIECNRCADRSSHDIFHLTAELSNKGHSHS